MQGILDAIVTLRDQQLCIIERLDKLSLGIRGQTTAKDMDHPLVASPAVADQIAPFLDAPRALFDMPHETLVHLGPVVRREQDPTSSEFTSHSRDLLLGLPLCTSLPISALRQCIQMQCCLYTELDSVADFYLSSPAASSQPLRLPNGGWELGTSIQTAMVKSLAQIVTHLKEQATYTLFKAWLLAVKDWVLSHTHTMPDNLGLAIVCTVAHLMMSPDVYSWLETCGTMGTM